VMEVKPGRNGYTPKPVNYCMAVERALPGTRVAAVLSCDVRMHEPGARVSSADAEGLARV